MSLEIVHTDAAPAAVGPYSQAVRIPANGLLYTAGQIAIDPATNTFESDRDVQGQAERALQNLSAVLEAAGSSLDRVVKTTVFLKNMSDFQAVNAVYARFFDTHKPARSAVAAADLPLGALVEVEAIATYDP